MRPLIALLAVLSLCPVTRADEEAKPAAEDGFVPLFDGRSLDGWTPQDKATSGAFRVEPDGTLLCNGPFTHLFYTGKVNNGTFKNFELRFDFKTGPVSNSGVFFHTDNPGGKAKVAKGYEAQICGDSYVVDKRKTGSLYAIEDVKQSPVKDDEWATYAIRVEGKRITLTVNGKAIVDYTEPENPKREKGREQRVLSSGTFALQAHDPISKVWFRNVRVKVLPD
jgi:hypothetical protein